MAKVARVVVTEVIVGIVVGAYREGRGQGQGRRCEWVKVWVRGV